MSTAEFSSKLSQVFIEKRGISTREEMVEFMCKEQEVNDFEDTVQYRFFLFPDYAADQSAIVMKSHHVFSDGLGISSLYLAVSDEYDPSALPVLKPLSCMKHTVTLLLSPFMILYTLATSLTLSTDNNPLCNKSKKSGKRVGGFSSDIDLPAMKKYCKERGFSINDYTSAILSTTLYDFYSQSDITDSRGKVYPVPTLINVGLPFSLRQPKKSI
mmetsp:Transcript_16071/g.27128  ORF Transcript_16071/g.27128 Transcript_16071/m.27128 type:complete len:214 (+) Transcript_16071:501-1142(+)